MIIHNLIMFKNINFPHTSFFYDIIIINMENSDFLIKCVEAKNSNNKYLALTEYLLDNDIPDYLISQYFSNKNVAKALINWFVDYYQHNFPTPKRIPLNKKLWHSVCNTPFDIISQTNWEENDVDNGDIIFIKWGNVTECYDANTIKTILKQINSIAIEWVKNPRASDNIPENELKQGVGFMPGKGQLYVKLWPHNVHVPLKSIKNLFFSNERYFIAKPKGKKRLGNIKGTRGVSELHGQEPLEEIYEIIEENKLIINFDSDADIEDNSDSDTDDEPDMMDIETESDSEYYLDDRNNLDDQDYLDDQEYFDDADNADNEDEGRNRDLDSNIADNL